MSNPSVRPSKRVKVSNSQPPQVVLPKRTPAELIDAIPPPLDYVPLPHRQINRAPSIQLPPHANKDPYSYLRYSLQRPILRQLRRTQIDMQKSRRLAARGNAPGGQQV